MIDIPSLLLGNFIGAVVMFFVLLFMMDR